jgi:choline dehydrogenase-like flavoprotein
MTAKLRLSPQVQREDGMLNISGTICRMRPHDPARDRATMLLRRVRQRRSSLTAEQAVYIARFLPAMFRNWISHRIGHALGVWRSTMLQLHAEQSPGGASTISLSNQRDALGLFRTRLHWSISQQELHTLRAFTRRMQQSFAQSGLGNVAPPAGFFTDDAVVLGMCKDSNHHMGSTRMSVAAADGVVDPQLRLHGVRNGYVCSASVFPTGGTSNPTHTLLALAMRLAEHLTQQPDVA